MDNKVFNVNGHGDDFLLQTLELVFNQGWGNAKARYWAETKEEGLVFCWYASGNEEGVHKLPAELTAEGVYPIVKDWLKGDFAKTVELSDWCHDLKHDGHNTMGFQVYTGDWGRVGRYSAICAIKPAYMWMGK